MIAMFLAADTSFELLPGVLLLPYVDIDIDSVCVCASGHPLYYTLWTRQSTLERSKIPGTMYGLDTGYYIDIYNIKPGWSTTPICVTIRYLVELYAILSI